MLLGLHIDKKLDWKCHIDFLAKNIASYCYAMKVIRDQINETAALSAYYAYIHSRLKYGIIFWGNSSDISRILILQKRLIRTMYGMHSKDRCKGVFISKNILTIISIYVMESVLFVSDNKDLFLECNRDHNHDTRLYKNLKSEKCNYTFIQQNIKFNAVKIYNSFPMAIRNLPRNKLKSALRGYLVNKAFYSVQDFFLDSSKAALAVGSGF